MIVKKNKFDSSPPSLSGILSKSTCLITALLLTSSSENSDQTTESPFQNQAISRMTTTDLKETTKVNLSKEQLPSVTKVNTSTEEMVRMKNPIPKPWQQSLGVLAGLLQVGFYSLLIRNAHKNYNKNRRVPDATPWALSTVQCSSFGLAALMTKEYSNLPFLCIATLGSLAMWSLSMKAGKLSSFWTEANNVEKILLSTAFASITSFVGIKLFAANMPMWENAALGLNIGVLTLLAASFVYSLVTKFHNNTHEQESSNKKAWSLAALSAIPNLLATSSGKFSSISVPLTLAACNLSIFVASCIGAVRGQKHRQAKEE